MAAIAFRELYRLFSTYFVRAHDNIRPDAALYAQQTKKESHVPGRQAGRQL